MIDNVKMHQHKKKVKIINALDVSSMEKCINNLDPGIISDLRHDIGDYIYYWVGDPTEDAINYIFDKFPLLKKFIALDLVFQRFDYLDEFDRKPLGVHISDFFPELVTVYDNCVERFNKLPNNINKAEFRLKPIACDALADADVEAAVYFASRGHKDLIDIDALKHSWHKAICLDIEMGRPVGKVPQNILERVRSRVISLAEAAEILKFNDSLPRFFAFRDEEEDFIDSAFFRTVEWFNITGFEPWMKSLISDLSLGPQGGINHVSSGWRLFFWCRSDLALNMAERMGLESWVWALINGSMVREKPWSTFWPSSGSINPIDYIPLAGIIPFVWHRISPQNMSYSVVEKANQLLFQTQMRSGGWPLLSSGTKPDLLSTTAAIHGLALSRPSGWEHTVELAANWLKTQQKQEGVWHIGGGPTVMITVLVLDALNLARGSHEVTFNLSKLQTEGKTEIMTHLEKSDDSPFAEPIYDYKKEEWYNPILPEALSKSLTEAHKATKPRIALIVATEIELKQILLQLTPLPRRKKNWKVIADRDTYYIGKFGAFEAVVMLCSMGSEGVSGSTLSIDSVIREWKPSIVILLGIAFGANRTKHLPGDVLVAEHIIPYEQQRIGDEILFRNPIPPASPSLIDRFRHALDWDFCRPDGSKCKFKIGPILSGSKLVDNSQFKQELLNQYPNAIGGEMEGAGLWSAADRHRKDWILVKGVCDWADGNKHEDYQQMAAASAVSLCKHVLNDSHALDGIGLF